MNKTGIDYLTHSWNPIVMRCTPTSIGCEHCWSLKLADRMEAREARKAERNKLCESAIAKLTPEEIDAIGLKKGR